MYHHCRERFPELIDIRFNHKVLEAGQDEDKGNAWVDVEIGGDGDEKRTERMYADYVVGCDGSGSAVRRSLFGREWPGQTFDCRFIVQNVYYEGFEKHGWEGGNYMVDPEHWGLIARRGRGGLWRVTYGDPVVGLTDEDYLARRPWHLKKMLPGAPEEGEYRIEHTNMYVLTKIPKARSKTTYTSCFP
jgi:2-polyprenyl-6-methoxyphenol hydroxylase-like FAD-dependent oxidoreductase